MPLGKGSEWQWLNFSLVPSAATACVAIEPGSDPSIKCKMQNETLYPLYQVGGSVHSWSVLVRAQQLDHKSPHTRFIIFKDVQISIASPTASSIANSLSLHCIPRIGRPYLPEVRGRAGPLHRAVNRWQRRGASRSQHRAFSARVVNLLRIHFNASMLTSIVGFH